MGLKACLRCVYRYSPSVRVKDGVGGETTSSSGAVNYIRGMVTPYNRLRARNALSREHPFVGVFDISNAFVRVGDVIDWPEGQLKIAEVVPGPNDTAICGLTWYDASGSLP